ERVPIGVGVLLDGPRELDHALEFFGRDVEETVKMPDHGWSLSLSFSGHKVLRWGCFPESLCRLKNRGNRAPPGCYRSRARRRCTGHVYSMVDLGRGDVGSLRGDLDDEHDSK